MAISPQEARNISAQELSDIQSLEAFIDQCLYRGQREYHNSILFQSKIRNELIRIYSERGWDVTYFPARNGNDSHLRFLEINED